MEQTGAREDLARDWEDGKKAMDWGARDEPAVQDGFGGERDPDVEQGFGEGTAAAGWDAQAEAGAWEKAGERERPDGGEDAEAQAGEPQAFREQAIGYASGALETLVEIMTDDKASKADRIRAANIVIERAYGKPDGTLGLKASKADMLGDIREEMERLRGETQEAEEGRA